MFSKVWVKPPEKQKQTVQRTVERTIRSSLRSKHKREKKKFNRIGCFYDHKEAFEAEGSKEKAGKRRGVCLCMHMCMCCTGLGVSSYSLRQQNSEECEQCPTSSIECLNFSIIWFLICWSNHVSEGEKLACKGVWHSLLQETTEAEGQGKADYKKGNYPLKSNTLQCAKVCILGLTCISMCSPYTHICFIFLSIKNS